MIQAIARQIVWYSEQRIRNVLILEVSSGANGLLQPRVDPRGSWMRRRKIGYDTILKDCGGSEERRAARE